MSNSKIMVYGNKLLANPSEPVREINNKIIKLIDRMFKIMYKHKGIGLAAVQIGVPKKVIIIDTSSIESEYGNIKIKKPIKLALINPEIVNTSEREEIMEEGCLSIPGVRAPVTRKFSVEIKGLTPDEKEVNLKLYDMNARVAQHEIDHTNGILFIDRVDKETLKTIEKDLRRIKKK